MIVVPVLKGGLGNNLFEICTCISHSLKHNIDYCIPTEIENPHYKGQEVIRRPKLRYLDGNINDLNGNIHIYKEPHFHYKEIPKFDCDYLILDGYWQSGKFFNEHRKEILNLFDFPYPIKNGWCSIHVRRTNYLAYPTIHPTVTSEYIEEAQITMMNKGFFKFLYVSDDIEYCKNKLPQFNECEYEYAEGRTAFEDLILASSCEVNIGSNSSFSWFIHWFNRNNKKVGIFPCTWFGTDLQHDTKDLYTDTMILL